MKVAVFDYKIIPTNPGGSSRLQILRHLSESHDFTVFAVEFDNPRPERIQWVKVHSPTRPLFLLFLVFHALAPINYLLHTLLHRRRFDLTMLVESNLSFGQVAYVHFCHSAYLKYWWKASRPTGVRGWARWLDHRLHALLEPCVYRRVRHIVVPSKGLARELEAEYPFVKGKVHIVANPVDVESMVRPDAFDRVAFRNRIGLDPDDVVLVFVALGHFERKGLPLLLEALCHVHNAAVKALVVGGEPNLVAEYRRRAEALGLGNRVVFVGMQRDVRPYLWCSDAFVFPTYYEAFAKVCLQAAAAGLPLIAAPVHGVEEYLRDGENGFFIERTVEGVRRGIDRFAAMPSDDRAMMGALAAQEAQHYSTERFISAWREFLDHVE
ncbi:MAG: glycosyltransferase family 4 protein [Chloroflexota bacterium]